MTYVGLRLILAGRPSGIATALARAKLETLPSLGPAWPGSWLKNLNDWPRKANFRDWPIPTPLMALREAYLAASRNQAAHNKELEKRQVYSNHLSGPKKWHTFSNYFSHYTRRNDDISAALRKHRRGVLGISDVKNFYPSIPATARKLLSTREQRNYDELSAFFSPPAKRAGLPVGSTNSHILANEILRDFDRKMLGKFGKRYFRYVDDVAVVSNSPEKSDVALQFVEDGIRSLGLTVNQDKTAHISKSTWRFKGPPAIKKAANKLDFYAYKQRLQKFAIDYPGHVHTLSRALAASGIFVPVKDLTPRIAIRPRVTSKARLSPSDRVASFITDGQVLRREFIESLRAQIRRIPPRKSKETLRKWHFTQLRRIVNSLLYLLPARGTEFSLDDLRRTLRRAKTHGRAPELKETLLVIDAICDGDATLVAKLPTAPVMALAELLNAHGVRRITIRWRDLRGSTRGVPEGVALLGLNGFATPPSSWMRSLKDRDLRALVSLCCGIPVQGPKTHVIRPLTRSLAELLTDAAIGPAEIFMTRFSPEEDSHLYGMDLGEGSYY